MKADLSSTTFRASLRPVRVVPIGDELVLVHGVPPRMTVLNGSGADLWCRLEGAPVAVLVGTPEARFMRSLQAMGLVKFHDRTGQTVAPLRPPPRVVHEGEVELLAYGTTGGPIFDKPTPGNDPGTFEDPADKD